MKINIDRYTLRLAKDNLGYFILDVLILIVFCYIFSFYQQKSAQNSAAISTFASQNTDYQKRISLINQQETLLKENINLDNINQIMTSLIPEKEDLFNIIGALNQLSVLTNFQITSYSVSALESTSKSVSVTVSGEGDREAFLRFLENYNFGSGRLITIDKIDYSETNSFSIRLKLNFYTSQTNTKAVKNVVNFTENDKKLIKKIESKYPDAAVEETTGEKDKDLDTNWDYKTKDKFF